MRPRRVKLLVVVGLLGSAGVVAGCEKALFPDDVSRSQYERYSLLRGQYRPATQPNEFGGQEPALRERLRPLSP